MTFDAVCVSTAYVGVASPPTQATFSSMSSSAFNPTLVGIFKLHSRKDAPPSIDRSTLLDLPAMSVTTCFAVTPNPSEH